MNSAIQCLIFSIGLLVCVILFIIWSITWFGKKEKEKEV